MNNKFWLTNVLIETGFEYKEDSIIGTKTEERHILIENGKVIEITIDKPSNSEVPTKDAKGLLILPSFKEKHIHLDKGHFGGQWKAATPFISVFHRIKEEEGFLKDFLPYTTERAEDLLSLITANGVTSARVQVNVDPVIGLENVERVKKALDNYSNKLDYELVAFPQHGLLRSNSVELMKESIKSGVDVVGGLDPATIDNNIEASLDKMMDIAVEFNKDIDIHIHDRGTLGIYTIKRLAKLIEEAKWNNRVTISHGYCLGDLLESDAIDISNKFKELGIGISTTCPIDTACPPIPLLYENGVNVNIINDNINDHWSPFGTGDLLQRASRMAEKFSWIDEYSLTRAISFITGGITPLGSSGSVNWPKVGDEASMIFINSSCSAEAVARISKREAVMFKGKIVSGSL